MKKCNGFTLIELLVTMAILAILISISTQSYNHIFSQQELVASTQQLYQFLTFARSQAIKNNQQIYVHFCHENGSEIWRVAQSDTNSCDCFVSNSCLVNGVEFNQALSDGHYTFVSSIKFGSNTVNQSQSISYKTMRFSTDSGHVTLKGTDDDYALSVVQSKVRIRICGRDRDQLGYPAC